MDPVLSRNQERVVWCLIVFLAFLSGTAVGGCDHEIVVEDCFKTTEVICSGGKVECTNTPVMCPDCVCACPQGTGGFVPGYHRELQDEDSEDCKLHIRRSQANPYELDLTAAFSTDQSVLAGATWNWSLSERVRPFVGLEYSWKKVGGQESLNAYNCHGGYFMEKSYFNTVCSRHEPYTFKYGEPENKLGWKGMVGVTIGVGGR